MKTQKFKYPLRFFILFLIIFTVVGTYFLGSEIRYVSGGNQAEGNLYYNYIYIGLSIILILWGLNIVSKKIIIDHTKLTFTSFFKNKEIQLQNIKGFAERTLTYKLIDENNNTFTTFKHGRLYRWLDENYDNIDFTKALKEIENSLNETRYGATEEERVAYFKTADKFDTLLTSISGACIALLVFIPIPNKILASVGLGLAFLIVTSLFYFKGKMRLERKTLMPSHFWTSFLTMGILFYVDDQYGGFNVKFDYKPMLYITLVLTILYIIVVGFKKYNYKTIWIPLVVFFGLSLMSRMALNVVLDTSTVEIHSAQVSDKSTRRSSRGYVTYTLVFSFQKKIHGKSRDQIDVSFANFDRVQTSDNVELHLHKGYFKSDWYEVYKEKKLLNGTGNIFSYLKYKILK